MPKTPKKVTGKKRKKAVRRRPSWNETADRILQVTEFTFLDGYETFLFQDRDDFAAVTVNIKLPGRPRPGEALHVDRFGVPDHEHGRMSVQGGQFWSLLDQLTAVHGLIRSISPGYLRYLPSGDGPPTQGSPLYMVALFARGGRAGVIAFETPTPPDGPPPLDMPDHRHWMPSIEPMPYAAAFWILQHVTVAEIKAGLEACNCVAPAEPLRMPPGTIGGLDLGGLDPRAGNDTDYEDA